MTDAIPDHPARDHTCPESTPKAPGRRPHPRQRAGSVLLAILTAIVPLAFAPAMPASASAAKPGIENAPARAAVAELTGDHPWSVALPADFAAEAGYRPVVEDRLLVDPDGACSSPIELPHEFQTACRAHDLGYDLLRYAEHSGQPLRPWARQAIDARLQQRMDAACDARPDTVSRARCDVVATVATTGVDLNSRRQNYATPDPEYLFGKRLSGERLGTQLLHVAGPAVLLLAMASALGVLMRRRFRPAAPAGVAEVVR